MLSWTLEAGRERGAGFLGPLPQSGPGVLSFSLLGYPCVLCPLQNHRLTRAHHRITCRTSVTASFLGRPPPPLSSCPGCPSQGSGPGQPLSRDRITSSQAALDCGQALFEKGCPIGSKYLREVPKSLDPTPSRPWDSQGHRTRSPNLTIPGPSGILWPMKGISQVDPLSSIASWSGNNGFIRFLW